MKKVFLGVGHGGNDPGAVGYVVEKDVNLIMALACRDYLSANGVEVKMSRTKDENDSLTEEIKECNAYNPDLAVDIHNNAGRGDGFEAFYGISGVGKPLAENIEAEVKAIGQNSRGLKTKLNSAGNADYYGFIRQIKCPSIIVEGVFVDNAEDVKIADTVEEQKAFGVAYAKGILKTLGIVAKEPVAQTPEPTPVTGKVATIQTTLNSRYGLNIAVDNVAGSQTKNALVKGLQKELNLQYNKGVVVDGVFGSQTKNASITLRKGARGNITWIMQARLACLGYNITVDGVFGNETLYIVKLFQKSKATAVDGVVGKVTWGKLFN